MPVGALLRALGQVAAPFNRSERVLPDSGLEILIRYPAEFLKKCHDSIGMTAKKLCLPAAEEILLTVMHLPSRLHWSTDAQAAECHRVAGVLRAIEERIGHRRTVLVGDFNVNPFASGMTSPYAFRGVSTTAIAKRGEGIVRGESWPFFYNPMWSCLGDRSPGPPGTYFNDTGTADCLFWYTLDQVLLRPELLDRYPLSSIRILDSIEGTSLLKANSGIPDRKRFSDHLPLLFSLDVTPNGG